MSVHQSLSVSRRSAGQPPRPSSLWSTRRSQARLSVIYADEFSSWDLPRDVQEPEAPSPVHAADEDEGVDDADEAGGASQAGVPAVAPPPHQDHLSPSQTAAAPVDLQIRNLRVSVQRKPSPWAAALSRLRRERPGPVADKTILSDINLDVKAGTLAAVIGSSGSGKTTLLNTIAERFSAAGTKIDGSITFNWRGGISSTRSAYVRQEDLLVPNLTVRETLVYASELRFPGKPHAEHARLAAGIMADLGLSGCAGTYTQRCSGGERRRVSIGIQLLDNPSVLLLDEPTTGLDAALALSVVATLQALSRRGRTVVMTIHQPRPEILALFDKLIVMCKGSPVYAAPPDRCLAYARRLGFAAPAHVNPADFIVGLASVDYTTPELERRSRARITWLQLAWKERSARTRTIARKPIQPAKKPLVPPSAAAWADAAATAVRRTRTLTRRNLLLVSRDKTAVLASILGAATLGLVAGLINLQLGRDETGIRARQGALYVAVAMLSAVYLEVEVYRLVSDIRVFDQDRDDGVVGPLEFVASRRLSQLLVEDVPIPLLFSLLFYFLAGLRSGAAHFFIFLVFTFLSHYIVRCWAMITIAIFRDYAGASLVSGLFITVQTFFAGFLIQIGQISPPLRWLRWLASSFYIYGGLASNEFSGVFLDCPLPDGEADPGCEPFVGDAILAGLGFPSSWAVVPAVVVVAYAALYVVVSVLVLHFKSPSIESTGSGGTPKAGNMAKAGDGAPEPQAAAAATADVPRASAAVEVRISDLSIYARGRQKMVVAGERKKTLVGDSLNMVFPAASFTAIMGPSGCGKTSLLKAIARRERRAYQLLGSIELRHAAGGVPACGVPACGYVPQHEQGLLASLTVRETLRHGAQLRLPASMAAADKHRRAEEVMAELGLADCADVRVGDAANKGISGGERRRVAIAMQLLDNPPVLVLDEPTSGLDVFTASAILAVLRDRAARGNTVIATVHQASRPDFDLFDNIVLMARGGRLCYTGPRRAMLSHLARLGLPCPDATNPADFALDLLADAAADVLLPDQGPVVTLADKWRLSRHLAEPPVGRRPSTPSSGRRLAAGCLSAAAAASGRPSTWAVYKVLVRRALTHYRRTPEVLVTRLVQVPVFALLLTLFFTPLHHDRPGIQTQAGYVQFLVSLFTVGLLQNSVVYVPERDLFRFEHADGASSLPAFFLQYLSLELPFEVAQTLLFSVLAVFAVGLPRTASMYAAVLLDSFLLINCGESLGIMFFSVFNHGGFALTVASLVLTVVELISGLVNPDMPAFVRGLANLSPSFHAVASIFPLALRDVVFTCDPSAPDGHGSACGAGAITGEDVLRLFNLDRGGAAVTRGFVGLLLCTLAYRLVAYVLLWLRHGGVDGWIAAAAARVWASRLHVRVPRFFAPRSRRGAAADELEMGRGASSDSSTINLHR